jgi:hypothetical protein
MSRKVKCKIKTSSIRSIEPLKCNNCGAEVDEPTLCSACCFEKKYKTPRDKNLESIKNGHGYFSDGKWIVLFDETGYKPNLDDNFY